MATRTGQEHRAPIDNDLLAEGHRRRVKLADLPDEFRAQHNEHNERMAADDQS